MEQQAMEQQALEQPELEPLVQEEETRAFGRLAKQWREATLAAVAAAMQLSATGLGRRQAAQQVVASPELKASLGVKAQLSHLEPDQMCAVQPLHY
jgi:hypothetical protein